MDGLDGSLHRFPSKKERDSLLVFSGEIELHGGRGEGSRTTQKVIVETSPSLLLILSVATGSSGEFSCATLSRDDPRLCRAVITGERCPTVTSDHQEVGQTTEYKRFVGTNPTSELITSGLTVT